MTVSRMLEKVLYAGFIQHHPWGITLRKGRHEGLITDKIYRKAFAEPLRYGLNGAYGTPKFSFPFRYLAEKTGKESEMVL